MQLQNCIGICDFQMKKKLKKISGEWPGHIPSSTGNVKMRLRVYECTCPAAAPVLMNWSGDRVQCVDEIATQKWELCWNRAETFTLSMSTSLDNQLPQLTLHCHGITPHDDRHRLIDVSCRCAVLLLCGGEVVR